MKVTCDRCHEEFYNVLKEQNKKVDGMNITRTFIECPNCGAQYTCYYDSQSTIVLKKQIRKQVSMLNEITDEKKREKKLKEIKKKQNRLSREEKILQTKFEKE